MTERARRAQIVSAAIQTIAELDYASASFKNIAARAGLSSTGLISYHFAGKRELVEAVFQEVLSRFGAFVLERLNMEATAAGELRAFLLANIEFMRLHRSEMLTFLRIQAHLSAAADVPRYAEIVESDHAKMADLLRQGQAAGEFRDFDADVMAVFILSLRNGLLARAGMDPRLDLDRCARELTTLVDLSTRR